jgi:hypothetical protein
MRWKPKIESCPCCGQSGGIRKSIFAVNERTDKTFCLCGRVVNDPMILKKIAKNSQRTDRADSQKCR